VLAQDAALECVAVLAAHPADVERILDPCLIGGLLKLAAIDELRVSHRGRRRLSGVLVLETAPQRGGP
jgi:hypothetical protein